MRTYTNDRPATGVATTTLPAGYYTDPAYFARETDAIFRRLWLFVGRDDDVPDPGSFVTRQIAGARVLIVRDDAGRLRAFHNVCRHRGTLLCPEPEGRVRGMIQCAYHSWTYRLDGRLHKAPHMEKVEGFAVDDWPLQSIPLDVWDGHVFVYLGDPGAPRPSLAQYLDGVDARFANWRMGELRTVARRTYQLHANWKLVIANYHECLHCANAHPQLVKLSHPLSGDNEPPHPTWLGASMDLLPGCVTMSSLASPPRGPLPGLDADERRHVYYYALLPTMLLNPHPDYVVTFALTPIAPDRTDITCHWLMHPDEIARPDFDPTDAVDFWDETNRQDWRLSDMAHAGIGSAGYRPGPYSNREELLAAFDRWVIERTGPL
ncbi:MAG: aromatic ring-hydroxylating dioxygenase subunit alpha [Vicinamibacterales bacterium]